MTNLPALWKFNVPVAFAGPIPEPYEQLLVADGLNVWSYDVDLEQVTVKPQDDVLGNTPALLLGGASSVLDEFDYAGFFAENETEWVLLAPRSNENGFTRIQLGFTDGQLSRMIFFRQPRAEYVDCPVRRNHRR